MEGIGRILDSPARTPTSVRRFLSLAIVVCFLCFLLVSSSAQAAPVQYFYIPFPEDQLLTAFQATAAGSGAATPANPITNCIAITAVADGTIIYYDQWENGYDIDMPNTYNVYSATNPGGTQIWGDGNPANGAPPGVPDDLISGGTVITLMNQVQTGTRQSVIDFDAGDKISATKTISVTRASWAAASLTMLSGCVEVFDTNYWGTDYRVPVGVNIPDATDQQMFEYTALSIMAGEDGATVSVDANADGDFTDAGDVSSAVLEEGESIYVTGLYVGGHVVSDRPVQVDMFVSDVGSNYESRDSALLPTNLWGSSYYTPVSTPDVSTNSGDERTTVWLYNPGASSITVTYARRESGVITTSTLTVPAGGYQKQILPPGGTGAHFYSTGAPFYGFSTTDSAGIYTWYNQSWDWGFSLIPQESLTTQALVGMGLGRDPTSTVNLDENGNPVWVTPVGNGDTPATVYVDYDGDPATGGLVDPSGSRYDVSYSLKELEQGKIYVPRLRVDATSSASTGDAAASVLSVSHTTGTLPKRLMLVGVAIANDANVQRNVQSVTYGGVALTYIGRVIAPLGGGGTPNSRPQVEIWALADPQSGTANVTVTLAGGARPFVVGVTTLSGVDVSDGLTSALGSFVSAAASSGTTQSVTVSTTSGQLVWDVVAAANYGRRNTADPSTFTVGAGQSQLWTQLARAAGVNQNGIRIRGAGSYETATGTSTAMSWTSTTSFPWAIAAVPINPYTTKKDQTGLFLYTLDSSVKLAVAWGQDPETCSPGEPGLDVGTSVPPMPEFTAGKDGVLYDDPSTPGIDGDKDGDGYITPGDEIVYPITVYNVSRLPVPDVIIRDEVPQDTTYVPGSTYLDGVTPIPDDVSGTPFPLDGPGYNLGTLLVEESRTVTFRVIIDDYEDLVPGTKAILNGGSAYALGWTDPVGDRAFLRGAVGDCVWYDVDQDGIHDPGEEGIAGVTITLLDGQGRVVYTDEGVPITTVTDDSGLFDFVGLLPGTYVVEFVPPQDAALTLQHQGEDPTVDSDPDPTTYRTEPVTLKGGERNYTIDAGLYVPEPTLAVVGSLEAGWYDGQVTVTWSTLSEVGTAGFYLQRQVDNGQWVTVNQEIVPALFESPSGGSYAAVDAGAGEDEVVTYRLLEVETSGKTRIHGPYQVVIGDHFAPPQELLDRLEGRETARWPRAQKPVAPVEEEPTALGLVSGSGVGDRLRIEVRRTGLYYLSAEEIAEGLGLSEDRVSQLISTKGLALTNRGKSVAYLKASDGSGLYFYGQEPDSVFAASNVYWLVRGKGTLCGPARIASAASEVNTSFKEHLHYEQNRLDFPGLFHEPDADFWLWDYMVAGDPELNEKTVALPAPGALEGLSLQVELLGLTGEEAGSRHHVEVWLNDVYLGEEQWAGTATHRAQFDIPEGVLEPEREDNELRLVALLDDGVPYSLVALDSVDLEYERAGIVQDDQLGLTASTSARMQVTGLSSSEAWILDVTSAQTPQVVKAVDSGEDEDGAWVIFGAARGHRYLVATEEGALRPYRITATNAPNLRVKNLMADYLVITTRDLQEAAEQLASYRAGQGLKTKVVTIDQVYDEFSYGLADPTAIQALVKYAVNMWKQAPSYLVLVGEGSYDYKDYSGSGDCMVPPLMVDTALGLVASDVALADVRGNDGVAEVAVGRLPVSTGEELLSLLSKMQAYESCAGAWRSSILLTADGRDGGGDFVLDSESIAQALPQSVTVNKAYVDWHGAEAVREALLGSFAEGALAVSYVGHAGIDVLAEESLLTQEDVGALPSGPALPVVGAWTCAVGQYAYPGYDSLSEALVTQSDAGAIAMLAPAGAQLSAQSVLLGKAFMRQLAVLSGQFRLGTALVRAEKAAAKDKVPAAILRTYNLLGDPGLSMRR